jgi:hypothetical protein
VAIADCVAFYKWQYVLILPETLLAPPLLIGFALPIGFAFLTTAVDLVSVYLFMDYASKLSARKNFILAPAGDACDIPSSRS